MTALPPSVGVAARGEPMRATPRMFDRFAALSGALEQAAAAIARLDALLTGHPLAARDATAVDLHHGRIRINEEKPRRD